MLVQAGDDLKRSSAGLQKSLAAAQANFLDGFQAVRHERRTDHQNFPNPILREPDQFQVGVGFTL